MLVSPGQADPRQRKIQDTSSWLLDPASRAELRGILKNTST
jgi:hypothetical protein